jgi:hypothetical protein
MGEPEEFDTRAQQLDFLPFHNEVKTHVPRYLVNQVAIKTNLHHLETNAKFLRIRATATVK